ncbi:hypothetical protein FBALC1_01272 [Flavobacteriales bacterium ALC-1]|nr:hypothetical protein FBALC1_01272 [Flavobacteriales bacterium ALC-1]
MIKNHFYALFIGMGICFMTISCEQDSYEEPELKPKTYSFSIPNKVSFNFSQLSENRESIIPYSNTLNIKNISNDVLLIDYVIFSFENDILNYDNLGFIKHAFTDVSIGSVTDSIMLEQSNIVFTDNNLITSILSFNDDTNDHQFNGLYNGELNVLVPTEIDTTFQRSITCTGFIDYQGKFNLFIEDEDEDNIVRLKGSFNSDNLISGNILNRTASSFSSVINSPQDTLELDGTNLKGYINYTDNNDVRLLKFNLTKQN